MINLLHRNDKFVAVYICENPTVNLSALCNSCAKMACCSCELIFTFVYADSSIHNASERFVSSIHLTCLNFVVHQTPQIQFTTKLHVRFKGLWLSNHSELIHIHMNFFLKD